MLQQSCSTFLLLLSLYVHGISNACVPKSACRRTLLLPVTLRGGFDVWASDGEEEPPVERKPLKTKDVRMAAREAAAAAAAFKSVRQKDPQVEAEAAPAPPDQDELEVGDSTGYDEAEVVKNDRSRHEQMKATEAFVEFEKGNGKGAEDAVNLQKEKVDSSSSEFIDDLGWGDQKPKIDQGIDDFLTDPESDEFDETDDVKFDIDDATLKFNLQRADHTTENNDVGQPFVPNLYWYKDAPYDDDDKKRKGRRQEKSESENEVDLEQEPEQEQEKEQEREAENENEEQTGGKGKKKQDNRQQQPVRARELIPLNEIVIPKDGSCNMDGSQDAHYRYKMPALEIKIEGATKMIKTVLVNLDIVAKSIGRPAMYIVTYLGQGCSSMSQFDKKDGVTGRAWISGKHLQSDLQLLIFRFIRETVLCRRCSNPETIVKVEGAKKKKTVSLDCHSCGHQTDMLMTQKFVKWMALHPPSPQEMAGMIRLQPKTDGLAEERTSKTDDPLAQLKAWKTSEAYRLKKMLKDGKITAKMYQEKKDETVSLYDSRKKEAIKKMTMKHNK